MSLRLVMDSVVRLVVPLLLSSLLISCGGGGTRPPASDGPRFVINAPLDGSSTTGTFFFSVQPIDSDEVRHVHFRVGSDAVGTDASADDGFRTFVVAADHPAGDLVLTAEVTGADGSISTRTATVTNVPSPPSVGTVGDSGAVLGTNDITGALSTMVIPPGTSPGASVSFVARTKEQVRDATGVDYDAMGITFLGAQEIVVDRVLDRTVGVTSGGFGPMVQPGQTVVNYMIGPDRDGDGVGEIVVANTATVAPNGDVVSDPVPQVQVGDDVAVSVAGRTSLAPLASGVSGPPGTALEIPVTGFNPSAPQGNVAQFEGGDGTVELFGSIHETSSGAQTFITAIPSLPPGPATLVLINLGTGHLSEVLDVYVDAVPALDDDPGQVVESALRAMLEMLGALDTAFGSPRGEGLADLGQLYADDVRLEVAALTASGSAEAERELAAMAGIVQTSGVVDRFGSIRAELASGSLRTTQAGCNDILDRADKSMNLVQLMGSPTGVGDVPAGEMQGRMFGAWWKEVRRIVEDVDDALGGEACRPPKPGPAGPGGPSSPSGMGAAVAPGGSLGGGVHGGSGPVVAPYALGPHDASTLARTRGRFVVKVSAGGSSVPFSGATDAGGYFFIPMVPAGQPYVAVAIDTLTNDTRTVDGVGPAVGAAHHLWFDFTTGESATREVRWDGGGDGVLWNDPMNWQGDMLPAANSDVVIDAPAGTIVEVAYPPVDIHSLRGTAGLRLAGDVLTLRAESVLDGPLHLDSGVLQLLGDLSLNGDSTWTGSDLTGTATLINLGQMQVDTSDHLRRRDLTGHLRNLGRIRMYGTEPDGFVTGLGATIVNGADAVFEVQDDVALKVGAGAPYATFTNRGTILKSSGAAMSQWTGIDVNHEGGTVDVREGTLYLYEGGTSTGARFEVDAGASLVLGANSVVNTMSGTYAGTGAGTVRLYGGFFDIPEAGATFDFPEGRLEWPRAEIRGPGTMTNRGNMYIIAGDHRPTLTGHLANEGLMMLAGTTYRGFWNDGATIVNRATGVFEFHDDQSIPRGDPVMIFTNAGTVRTVGGTGISQNDACYQDAGGTLQEGVTFTCL